MVDNVRVGEEREERRRTLKILMSRVKTDTSLLSVVRMTVGFVLQNNI